MEALTLGTLIQIGTAILAFVTAIWMMRRDGDAREGRILDAVKELSDRMSASETHVREALATMVGRLDGHEREHGYHRSGLQSQGARLGSAETTLAVHEHRLGNGGGK